MSTTIFRAVSRDAAPGITARKRAELGDIALAWQSARTQYIRDYWDPQYADRILRAPRRIREERRRLGWASADMTVGYHQTALMSALGVLRGNWALTIQTVSRRIGTDKSLTPAEVRWLRRVMRSPSHLQRCLDAQPVRLDAGSPIDEARLARRLRRLILLSRAGQPRPERGLWFEVDAEMYRPFHRAEDRHFRGSWIAITGLRAGRRVCVPLKGRSSLFDLGAGEVGRPTLRVTLTGARVRVAYRERLTVSQSHGEVDIGIDKGYRTLRVASSGDPLGARSYGAGADRLTAQVAGMELERLAQRRRLAAHERSVRNSSALTSRRIRRNNLGTHRLRRAAGRQRAQLRDEINRSLNALFTAEAPMRRIFAERLDIRGRSFSRAANRRLGRWSSGYLQRRLAYKAELNGVELAVVNAAYTSQTCPRCWFTSGSNRRQERFLCTECGYTGSADAVAATNVLRRGRDPAISRFMPLGGVKQILDERWRSARSGRAWGSNDGSRLIPVVGQELEPVGAANNWSSGQSTSAKP